MPEANGHRQKFHNIFHGDWGTWEVAAGETALQAALDFVQGALAKAKGKGYGPVANGRYGPGAGAQNKAAAHCLGGAPGHAGRHVRAGGLRRAHAQG